MTASVIHVRYTELGTWIVHLDEQPEVISKHVSATEATWRAFEFAHYHSLAEVVIHDAYNRCRASPVLEGGQR